MRCLLFELCGDHRDLHGHTHSSPTRRSSDLPGKNGTATSKAAAPSIPASTTGCRTPRPSTPSRPTWPRRARSEEHTSELQSLMRISYAVFCLKKKNIIHLDILHHPECDTLTKIHSE